MSHARSDRNPEHTASDYYPQVWLLLLSVLTFCMYVAWDLRVFNLVLSVDRSYMASLTIALVLLATAHCGWHVLHCSRRIKQAQAWLQQGPGTSRNNAPAGLFIHQFVQELDDVAHEQHRASDDDAIVEIHADRARGPVDLGWFFVDLAVRLGLLGTIIGFILIFASLSELDISGGDDLKNLLIAMSGGMGTALLTTLTGLVGATVLSFQYLILGRESEYLVGLLLRVRNRHHSVRTTS